MVGKFPYGQVVSTPGALDALQRAGRRPEEFLARHLECDWGDLDEHDRQANEQALSTGARLLSSYKLSDTVKIWIITEADRSSTCLLTPEEY